MNFSDLKNELSYIDHLVKEFNRVAPATNSVNDVLRAELSGLLLVAICAVYENVIKKIMIEYADSVHGDFSYYIEKNYKKLNSKISKEDLCKYLKLFSNAKAKNFTNEMLAVQTKLGGIHPNEKYSPLLDWRHAYAHSKTPQTTIEEAYKHHRYSKHIIYAFNRAINS